MLKNFKHPQCTKEIERILNIEPFLHFLNTTIVPPGADGAWIVEEVESGFIRHCLLYLGHSGAWGFVQSHIGHEATAAVASDLFEQKIDFDRTPWDGSGLGVAIQLKGRLPEGKLLSREELETIGYSIRVVLRIVPPSPQEIAAIEEEGRRDGCENVKYSSCKYDSGWRREAWTRGYFEIALPNMLWK